jgi:ATP-dependent helicase/nuclease subunit A
MSVLEDVFGILENPDYKTLFDGQGIAEVSVGGWVETGLGKLQVSGQIDRLSVSEQQVTILDYKTNRNVPHSHQTVPFEYRVQLALYRQMIREIYPDKTVTCALMWTRTPEMMILPDNLLDETLELFKKQ